jgi:anti-anti-sigma factor
MCGDSYRLAGIVDFDASTATLHCLGEEDRCTQASRRPDFTRAIRAQRDVTVDLAGLVFADSSMMLDLAALARRLRIRGAIVRIRQPQPQVMTLIELTGLHRLAGIKLEPSPTLT